MKISYRKTHDKDWYIINQIIKSENQNENELLLDCLTNFSIKQNNKIYSAWLSSVSILRNILEDKRLLYRNSFFILI